MNLKLLIALGIWVAVEAQPYFSIVSPTDLAEQFGVEPSEVTHANFGHYEKLVYKGKLCFQRNNRLGCDKFHISCKIIIVYRGTCKFVTKTRHAQAAGAELLVVVDNKPEPANTIIMGDDGTGGDINIAAIMITKDLGEEMSDYFGGRIKSGKVGVEVRLKEKEVHPEKVKLDFFYNSLDIKILNIIVELSALIEKCKNKIQFEPHLQEDSCKYCSAPFQRKHCDCGGQYCIFQNHQQISGVVALEEVLRELCLFYENSLASYEKYMVSRKEQNFDLSNEDQIILSLSEAGVDPKALQTCIDKSFDSPNRDECTKNTLLEKQREFRQKYPDLPARSILINNRRYTGLMEPKDVMEAVLEVLGDPDNC